MLNAAQISPLLQTELNSYLSSFLNAKNLKEIDARANPLSLETIVLHVRRLEKRGIKISYEQGELSELENEARETERKLKKIHGDILGKTGSDVERIMKELHGEIHGLSSGIND